ncbi:SE1561 family protein [Planococcus dechangensis]|uniref:SE1561 family protein n=1 Tax=Planococcus dechangensis TaxID=1176255 RepID=A0ABV9M9I9_9BACL
MGKSITDKEQQVSYMKQRLSMFLDVLDAIEPESTELEDIDRLIAMVDDLEDKMEQFKNRPASDRE